MIIANVNFTAIEIKKYTRGEPVVLRIFMNDGKENAIEKTTNLDNAEEFIQQIMNEARKLAKENNAKNTGGFLDDVVQVRFGDDEEKTEEKLFHAFSRIKEDIKRLRMNTAQGLLQKMAMIQGSRYNI